MTATLTYVTDRQTAYQLALFAVRALYFEVKVYPKPGLVSFIDAGAHLDMTGKTFYQSLVNLRHYFKKIALKSMEGSTFAQLKLAAIEAEQHMLIATKGINTHRGAIFALGLVLATTARLIKNKKKFTAEMLSQQLISDWQQDLAQHTVDNKSHGALVSQLYFIKNARSLAMEGYQMVFALLPSFIKQYRQTKSLNDACLEAYLKLLLIIDDTNILYRQGQEGMQYARNMALDLLNYDCLNARQQKALIIHHLFAQQGISPGGVADMLSMLLLISQLFGEQLQCH